MLHALPEPTFVYRLRQLGRALTGRVSADEQAIVARVLNLAEQQLFTRMPQFDQRHALDVYTTLQQAGIIDTALLHAALLHDTGKVDEQERSIPLVYYGAFVVLKRLAPALYRRAAANGSGLLHPFTIHATHEQRSVTYAVFADSPPEVVTILRDYAARQTSAATMALAWADDLN